MQVKSDGDSLIGISLEFLSNEGEVMLVLLASHGNALLTMNQFSSKFNKVIMPHRVIRPESSDGWVLQENVIAMSGYTLTEIRTVCYKLRPQLAEQQISEYYAVLGHLSIQTSGQNVQFPPSSSWAVVGQDVTWKAGRDKSKSVSFTVLWRLKDGIDYNDIEKYIVYIEKTPEADANLDVKLQAVQEFLGTALVEVFYVSDLLVPSGISSLKFIIQVHGVDGTCQPLDDSPFFQLDVEG